MTESTVFSVRIDQTVKDEAVDVFKKLGLNLNSGIDIYLRTVARTQSIPFSLSLKDNPSISITVVELSED